jgi:hypothetical protein
MVVASVCAGLGVALVLASSGTGDYLTHAPVAGDNAGPAIDSLAHGNIHGFIAQQPFMGLTSLLVRVPFALLASLLGWGNTLTYAAGAAACLTPAALLALWMMWSRRKPGDWFAASVAALVLLASPVALDALGAGHPEELLASTLATAAVLVAMRGRGIWAAVLLGLAVGTKQWTVIAAVPVIAAATHGRLRLSVVAAVIAVILSASTPLADLATFARASHAVGGTHTANVASIWWPFSASVPTPAGATTVPTARWLPLGLTRSQALAVLFALLVAVPAAVVMSRRRRPGHVDGLALLALLGVVRCLGDPGDLDYYFLAALVPLTAWEVISLGRAPLVAVITAGGVALTFGSGNRLSPALLNGLVIAWTIGIGCYVGRGALARGSGSSLLSRDERAQVQSPVLR